MRRRGLRTLSVHLMIGSPERGFRFEPRPDSWFCRFTDWLASWSDRGDDDLTAGSDDNDTVKYVKGVFAHAIADITTTVEITAKGGRAHSPGVDGDAPFIEVRNRLAVMTDTIKPWSSLDDQRGRIEVTMRGDDGVFRAVAVAVDMRVRDERIILTCVPTQLKSPHV